MIKYLKQFATVSIFLFCLMLSSYLFAAGQQPDFFQAIGKIYVVVVVICVLFIGLMLYLYNMDKRISKLENQDQYGKDD